MILIDAVYINNGGGKILLDYLITSLEATELNILYLLDKRVENKIPGIKSENQFLFIEPDLRIRNNFYKKHHKQFEKVLCFGNIPPNKKLSSIVYTYFHRPQFLRIPNDYKFLARLKFLMKILILKRYIKNSDFWMVQSDLIKSELLKKFHIHDVQVKILPFYSIPKYSTTKQRKKDAFVYASSGAVHKNQERLIKAFCRFYDEFKTGELHLTIGEEYVEVIKIISGLTTLGYPIINHGFVSQEELHLIYQSCEYSIYPSLTESFGLGIIEAIENECKMVGADQPYMHAVCEPSLVFDPESVEDIYLAFKNASQNELRPSKVLASNRIDDIISFLK